MNTKYKINIFLLKILIKINKIKIIKKSFKLNMKINFNNKKKIRKRIFNYLIILSKAIK